MPLQSHQNNFKLIFYRTIANAWKHFYAICFVEFRPDPVKNCVCDVFTINRLQMYTREHRLENRVWNATGKNIYGGVTFKSKVHRSTCHLSTYHVLIDRVSRDSCETTSLNDSSDERSRTSERAWSLIWGRRGRAEMYSSFVDQGTRWTRRAAQFAEVPG